MYFSHVRQSAKYHRARFQQWKRLHGGAIHFFVNHLAYMIGNLIHYRFQTIQGCNAQKRGNRSPNKNCRRTIDFIFE